VVALVGRIDAAKAVLDRKLRQELLAVFFPCVPKRNSETGAGMPTVILPGIILNRAKAAANPMRLEAGNRYFSSHRYMIEVLI
jgi:hypothetical protein